MREEEKNKIEDIKMHLYDPNEKAMSHQREGVLHQVDHDFNDKWKEDNQIKENSDMNHKFKKPPVSIFKKFFLISVIFFLAALGFAFYKFYYNDTSVSGQKINIEVIGSAFAKGGDELPLQIEITNNNAASLEFTNLIIEYPKGADDNTLEVIRLPKDPIGTIKSGESVMRNVKVKLYGQEKSVRNIKVSLEYHPEGSNAIFTKDKYYPVTISIAPLSIDFEAPNNTTSNQPVTFKITATLNTSLPEDNPILQMTYPNNFIFDEALPAPIVGNSVWDLSTITAENPIVIEVRGRLVGEDNEEQVFHAYAGTTNGTNQSQVGVVYSSVLHKILITKPFLEANILVDSRNQKEYAVSGGKIVNVEIAWANNLTTRVTDGQIIVNLSGNVFDKSTVKAMNGFYDSANNQIIWDRNSNPELSEINPGENGTVSFSFVPTSLIGLSTIKNPQVSIKVSIKGREPLFGSTYNDINNFSEKVVKVVSDFQIASSAVYSTGSLPPKAETETKYIVTWTLSNSANNITGASARSALPIYVKWVGLALGTNDNLSYNDVTREVVWNIGQVLPNTGISSNREISFVIALKPSLSQVGSVPQLMKDIFLTGTDSFTNTTINSKHNPINTSLLNDPNFKPGNGQVVK